MAVPKIVQDGAAPFGTPNSGIITINNVPYVLEEIDVDRPAGEANSADGRGVPNRARYTAQIATLTGTLQLTSETPYPKFGDTFVYTAEANYGAETWIVQPQKFEASNSDSEMRTAPLVAKLALNPDNIVLTN